jgi:hypothetical protein
MSAPPEFRRVKPQQTLRELKELQRLTMTAILRPLTADDQMRPDWVDGGETRRVADLLIRPNDRLTSFERLEIYNRQYWFRLIDVLYEEFPGLRAVVGEPGFNALVRAYLTKYPSRSFSLRNLGGRLPQFLTEEPKWAGPRAAMALDMARFEWAQTVAFDEAARPALGVDDLLGADPSELRLSLQPYLTLLEMSYPLDEFSLVVRRSALRSDASNAAETDRAGGKRVRKFKPPRKRTVRVAVHRYRNALYYKRLEPVAFGLLGALRDGATLLEAVGAAIPADGDERWPARIKEWFQTWTGLGWFCKAR